MMANVELNLIFNASDVFRALDELEARLAKFQGQAFQINIGGNFQSVTQQAKSLSNVLNELRTKGAIDIKATSNLSNTVRQIKGEIDKISDKRISLTQVGSLYMLSNVFDRFASRLSSIFDSAFNAFQQSATALQKTRIVSGAPTAEYDKFVSELRKLAPQVMIPFPDLAEIAYSFATRGYANLATAPDVLRPLAISSLITGETLDTMARSILSLMQSWNPRSLQSLENLAPMLVRQFSDLMSYAFAKSPLEVRWFKDIANYAAPLFAQLGYSPAETMAFFMSMAQQIPTPGIGARSARMLLFNVQDIEKSFKIYEKYGIDAAGIFREVSENGGTLADAFKALYDALQSLPKEQLVSVYKQLGGGVRGGMAAMMLGQGELLENISTYIDKLTRESIGYTSIVAAQYRTTPVGIFESAQANLTAKLSELGESVAVAKAALLEFQASLIDVVNKLPKGLVAFGYGAAQGAQFSSRYIIDTIANIGLASYITKMLGGGALSSLITGGLISAAILPLVAGGYTAYKYVQAKQTSSEARAVQEAIVGESPVEAAARILRTLKTELEVAPIAPYVSIPILKRVYEFETLEGIQRVYNKKAFTPIISILEEYGNVLEDSVIRFSARLGSGSSAFRKQASELEVAAKSFFSNLYKTFSFNETQLANVSGWEKIFKKMGLENADVLTSNVATIIERLKESGKGILSEKGVTAGLQQIIAAGLIEKATGAEGFTEFVASLYNIDLSMQDIEALISTIAQSIPEISQKVSEIASQQKTRQEPSYASLLDLWLKGAIMEPSLMTELPALKAGDWPVERTWVSGNYTDTVAIGWKVLTPEAITTSANLDAAIKPSLIFQ